MVEFPNSVKNFLALQDGVDSIIASHPNDRGDEITALETFLGAMGVTQAHTESLKNLLLDYRKYCTVKADTVAQIKVGVGKIAIPDASDNVKWKRNTSEVTVTWADIDTGAEESSKRYYVHAVGDASGTTFTVIISLSSTAPTGITFFHLIGSFYNDSGGDITDVMDTDLLIGKTPGEITAWITTTAPGGAILCDGSAQDASGDDTLDDLFAKIGTTFGGSDETDFQVPDMRGRTIIGLDNLGGASANRVTSAQADSIGGVDGAESVTLSAAQSGLVAHTHLVPGKSGGAVGTTANFPRADTKTDDGDIATETNSAAAAGSSHSVMSPYMALAYIIWK